MERWIGPYRLRRRLSGTGRRQIWLAAAPVTGAPVVVKRAHADGVGRSADLDREARLLGVVAHPHLLPLLDVVGPADGPPVALVVPYLAGGTLADLLDERGSLEPGELVAVLLPIAAALEALHRHDVVHGDVTPANVLLAADGTPVLADLGSAVVGDAVDPEPWWTPTYVDPALAAGGAVAPTADVFSLGVIAYEALTGRRPHRGEPAEVLAAAAVGAHRSLLGRSTVHPALARVVEGALAPDPGDRPASPRALLTAMRGVVDPATVALPGPARRAGAVASDDAEGDGDEHPVTLPFPLRPPAPAERPPSRRWARWRRWVAWRRAHRLRGTGAVRGPRPRH